MKVNTYNQIFGLAPIKIIFGFIFVCISLGVGRANAGLVDPGVTCGTDTNGFETCAAHIQSTGAVTYTYNSGTGIGHVVFSGTPGNMTWRPDQFSAAEMAQFQGSFPPATVVDPFGNGAPPTITPSTVAPTTGQHETEIDFYIDGATGEFVNSAGIGSVSIIGKANAAFNGSGIPAVVWQGVTLDGVLTEGDVFDAGAEERPIDGSVVFDFRYFIDATSLLSFAEDNSYGTFTVFQTDCDPGTPGQQACTGDLLTQSWTSIGTVTSNVYIPVPAGVWLFLSAISALGLIRRIGEQ